MNNYEKTLNRLHNLVKFMMIFNNNNNNLLNHDNTYIFEKWNALVKCKIDIDKKITNISDHPIKINHTVLFDHQNKWKYSDNNRKEINRILILLILFSSTYNYDKLIKYFNYYINDFKLVNYRETPGVVHTNLAHKVEFYDKINKKQLVKIKRSCNLEDVFSKINK
jgi:hypothetical protein